MQHAGKITTFVHSTHFRSQEVAAEGPISALSTYVCRAVPVYRVMLWRNNPYHIYTGFVEASITNGDPSQRDKMLSAEHPMWLINSYNKLAADRKIAFSVGWLDIFFDKFIPVFQHFIRCNVLGKDAADAARAADPFAGYETERTAGAVNGREVRAQAQSFGSLCTVPECKRETESHAESVRMHGS